MKEDIEEIKDTISAHDKTIEHLVAEIKELTKAISSQNLLFEKFNNMDTNIKEAMARVYKRIEAVEKCIGGNGCNTTDIHEEKIKVINKRIEDLEGEAKKIINPSFLKTIILLTITYSVAFSIYLVDSIHSLEKKLASHSAEQKVTEKHCEERTSKNENLLNRNYGYMKGREVKE